MTAIAPERLEAAIDTAYTERPAPHPSAEVALSDHVGMFFWDFTHELWGLWDCESDECPARPAWRIALSEECQQAKDELHDEVISLIRARLAEFAERFQDEHPEAVLRVD